MSAQLSLDLESTKSGGSAGSVGRERAAPGLLSIVGFLGRRLIYWAPVWLPLGFLFQVAWFGLRAARADERRLDRAQAEVYERFERLQAEGALLEEEQRMLADDVYRERVRRTLNDPELQPLRLEDARALRSRESAANETRE